MTIRCRLGLHRWRRALWLDEHRAGLACSNCPKVIRWQTINGVAVIDR